MILESLWNPYNTNPSVQRNVIYPTSCIIEPFIAVTDTLDNSLTEEELNRFGPLQNSAEEPGSMETPLNIQHQETKEATGRGQDQKYPPKS